MSAPGAIPLLVAALRGDGDPVAWSAQLQQIDSEKIAVPAMVLGMAPLLHWQLSAWHIVLAPRAQAKLAAAREASTLRQQAIQCQLVEILDACRPAGIEPLVLKGAYLAAHIYPQPGLRPMNDIDLLVRPEALA